ncbi:ribonuclease H-like domain-containing protein [Arhodomonas sp. SL1]|uniref:ribonuclease H-like domain-containing protein n=1 Tax=Arhodomonas sp. SL1 TaxID=3425691 RepID=UPI003F883CF5
MNLKSRLDALRRQAGADAAAAEPRAADSALAERLRRLGRGRGTAGGPPAVTPEVVAGHLGGEALEDGVVRVTRRLPLPDAVPRDDGGVLPGIGAFPGERAVFLDTETSGLAGGTGTVAYLVGLARIDSGALVADQFLMTRFGHEPALLAAVRAALGDDAVLVSYNGRSFDAPLLRDRFRLAGQDHRLEESGHADLLHPVRRLFRHTWPDCRLATAEERLLGLHRQGDLPGSAAPLVWSELLRLGRMTDLPRVLEHNRRDLLSLAALWPLLADAFRAPHALGASPLAAARAWYHWGEEGRARSVLEYSPGLDTPARRELARLRRRAGDWQGARRLWEDLAAEGDHHAVEALAKYYEHVRRDWDGALAWTGRLPPGPAVAHRRRRIERKRGGAQRELFAGEMGAGGALAYPRGEGEDTDSR